MNFIKLTNQDYEMADAPVTQAEWQEIMGDEIKPYFKNKPNNPMESVSFNDIQEFIKIINIRNDGYTYSFPSEEEWQYCAKSCDEQNIDEISWNYENSNMATQPVKTKKPNDLGLYDMLGNVWEWTSTNEGSHRVIRGGGWGSLAQDLRSAARYGNDPSNRNRRIGFRLLRTANTLHSYPFPLDKAEQALSVAKAALKQIEDILK